MSPRIRAALACVGGLEDIWSGRRVHHFDQWCRPNRPVPADSTDRRPDVPVRHPHARPH